MRRKAEVEGRFLGSEERFFDGAMRAFAETIRFGAAYPGSAMGNIVGGEMKLISMVAFAPAEFGVVVGQVLSGKAERAVRVGGGLQKDFAYASDGAGKVSVLAQ